MLTKAIDLGVNIIHALPTGFWESIGRQGFGGLFCVTTTLGVMLRRDDCLPVAIPEASRSLTLRLGHPARRTFSCNLAALFGRELSLPR